jgi:hypothetical protein
MKFIDLIYTIGSICSILGIISTMKICNRLKGAKAFMQNNRDKLEKIMECLAIPVKIILIFTSILVLATVCLTFTVKFIETGDVLLSLLYAFFVAFLFAVQIVVLWRIFPRVTFKFQL